MRARVFVNGCFDVLHVGHIRLLQYAASFGELSVAINSDASIKRLKGEKRPFNNQFDRAELIYALRCVHSVIMFEQDTPVRALETLYACGKGPRYVIKGAQYRDIAIPEADVVALNGGQIVFFNSVPNQSSTRLIECLES